MAQTILIDNIIRTGEYPVKVPVNVENHCGTLQLILGDPWSDQMIHELPAINVSIFTPDNIKYMSFDIDMSTVNEEMIKLQPTYPYFIAIYNIPESCSFSLTPLFDKYALSSHNSLIKDGNIEIFNTSSSGVVDSDEESYTTELWTTPTNEFNISIIFDNTNIYSGEGMHETVAAEDVAYDPTGTELVSTNVQEALTELDSVVEEVKQKVYSMPDPMVFKGSLGQGGTIEELPQASSENNGYTYKVITDGTYQGVVAKVGDSVISDGTEWILIPSGDEPGGTVTNVSITSSDGSATISGSPITSSGVIDISVNIDSSLNENSSNPVTNALITQLFTPISQQQYDALTDKSLPVYFVYEL